MCLHLDQKRALVRFLFTLVWWILNQRWRSCVAWPGSCCCVCCHRKTPSPTRCAAASPRSSPPKVLSIHPSMEGKKSKQKKHVSRAHRNSREASVAKHLLIVCTWCDAPVWEFNLTVSIEGRQTYIMVFMSCLVCVCVLLQCWSLWWKCWVIQTQLIGCCCLSWRRGNSSWNSRRKPTPTLPLTKISSSLYQLLSMSISSNNSGGETHNKIHCRCDCQLLRDCVLTLCRKSSLFWDALIGLFRKARMRWTTIKNTHSNQAAAVDSVATHLWIFFFAIFFFKTLFQICYWDIQMIRSDSILLFFAGIK